MISVQKDAFSIVHFESLLAQATQKAGVNLLPNRGFELGAFTNWTNTNWSIVGSESVTPNGKGLYAAQAASASSGQISTLTSNRVAVSGGQSYQCSIDFGSPASGKKKNNLRVRVLWYDAPSGGNLLRADILIQTPVRPSDNLRQRIRTFTAPLAATHVAFEIKNTCAVKVAGAGKGLIVDSPFVAGEVTVVDRTPLATWQYGQFLGLKYSKHWQQGYKRATFRLRGSGEYLYHFLTTALGQWVEIFYQGAPLFEGKIWTLTGRVGKRDYDVSLDTLANFVRVPYGDDGEEVIETNPESIERYGRKDLRSDKSFKTRGSAEKHGKYLLQQFADPLLASAPNPQSGVDYIDVELMGLFATTGWVTGLPPVFKGEKDTAEIMATLPKTNAGGKSVLDRLRQDTPNAFISGDYSLVENTGLVLEPLEGSETSSAQETLIDLIERGSGNKRALVCGVTAGRKFFVRERPTTLGYVMRRSQVDDEYDFFDAGGAEIPRALVEPGQLATFDAPIPNFDPIPADFGKSRDARMLTEIEYDAETNVVTATMLGNRRFDISLAKNLRMLQKRQR